MLFVKLSQKMPRAESVFAHQFFFCLFKVDIYELLIVPLICQLLFGIMKSSKPRDESENNRHMYHTLSLFDLIEINSLKLKRFKKIA